MSDNINISADERFMREAIKEACECIPNGDVPIGAVIVYNGDIIGRGRNAVELTGNPLAHAEMMAIESAIKNYGHKHLIDCTMYVTLEPCSMCSGAIVLARIDKLVYGAPDPKTGASGSLYSITSDERLNHRLEVISGILHDECSSLLKDFFKDLRQRKQGKME